MTTPTKNLLTGLPTLDRGEAFEDLMRCRNVRIERIVSSGKPDQVEYDQAQDEWVCLLQGAAELWVAGELVQLQAGDHLFLAAHTHHRVLRTSREPPCVWLAVHIDPSD